MIRCFDAGHGGLNGIGRSPSGKAADFGSAMRRFESSPASFSHPLPVRSGVFTARALAASVDEDSGDEWFVAAFHGAYPLLRA